MIWLKKYNVEHPDDMISLGNYLKAAVGRKYFTVLTDFSQEATVWLITNYGELLKKTFTPDKKNTAVYRLHEKFGVEEGVVFYDDLKKKNIPTLSNHIGRAGEQWVYGKGYPFDALVIFRTVSPFVFE